jgi:hypothetical protein
MEVLFLVEGIFDNSEYTSTDVSPDQLYMSFVEY